MTVELARALATDGLDKGVCFVTFGGEESGLNGSQAFVERARVAGKLPKFMVNLDVVATGKTIELIGDRELQTRAERIGQKQGASVRLASEPANSSSDHASFRAAGVPAIFIAGDDYSMIHTPGDNLSVIVPATVEAIGDLALALIKELEVQVARG
jgi:Zn-dependent M28 family amino/carboxypeptidase